MMSKFFRFHKLGFKSTNVFFDHIHSRVGGRHNSRFLGWYSNVCMGSKKCGVSMPIYESKFAVEFPRGSSEYLQQNLTSRLLTLNYCGSLILVSLTNGIHQDN